MKSILIALLITPSAGVLAQSLPSMEPPPMEPPYFRVRYEESNTAGELAFAVSYTVWIPPGVKRLRGVIVHQHGCGERARINGYMAPMDLHWQALARKHQCALLGPAYEEPPKANCRLWCEPRNGSEKRYLQALHDLGSQSGHPELETIPWALWGHSGGGVWAGTMLLLHPDRIAAAWLRSGYPTTFPEDPSLPLPDITPATCAVPVMCNLGTKEGVTEHTGRFAQVWEKTQLFFKPLRAKGGLVGVAVDPNSSHDCGNSRYLAIPWFDACLTARLPQDASAPMLKTMSSDSAWLAPLLGDAALPASRFTGDAKSAVWLPDERIAKTWAEYTKDGNVTDLTPPPGPGNLQLVGNTLTWTADADLESGIAAFIIERDGTKIARLPATPSSTSFGRPVFQSTSYSDSPTPPLAEMKYTDITANPGQPHRYRVITVNSTGLKTSSR